ncbi:recombinase family protein [Myxococcota bacterium]
MRHATATSNLRGWCDYRVFKDLDESGARDNRPQWNRLRREIRAGRVIEVMATEIARLGRSAVSVILALDEISRAGCNVILTRQGLDYATPVGRMVAQILAAVAEMEREQSAERRRAGIAQAREKGTRSGKPIGRPRRQIDARRAARLRSEGRSWREVARLVWGSTNPPNRLQRNQPDRAGCGGRGETCTFCLTATRPRLALAASGGLP